MQAGGATMMLAPPPLTSLVGVVAPSALGVKPMLTITQSSAPPLLSYQQAQQHAMQVTHTASSVAQTSSQQLYHQQQQQQQQERHQSPMLSRSPISSSASLAPAVTHHHPTSAVTAVTEMLKRKLQQRLLAETAKKRCLLTNGSAISVTTDGKQVSHVDSTTTNSDFAVDVWNKSIVGTSLANRLPPPHHSALSLHPHQLQHQQNFQGAQPIMVSASSTTQPSPHPASTSATPVTTQMLYYAGAVPPKVVGIAPSRKPKKKLKKKKVPTATLR